MQGKVLKIKHKVFHCGLLVLLSASHYIYLISFNLESAIDGAHVFSALVTSIQLLYSFLLTRDNLFFLIRVLLIASVGLYAFSIKMYGLDWSFSVYEFRTQTFDIAFEMYALTVLAIGPTVAGLVFGERAAERKLFSNHLCRSKIFERVEKDFFTLAAIVSVLIFSSLIVSSSSGTIFEVAYGLGSEGDTGVGVSSQIISVSIAVLAFFLFKMKDEPGRLDKQIYFFAIVACVCYGFIWAQLVRGLRQDVVMGLAAIFFVYCVFNEDAIHLKAKYVIFALIGITLLEFLGLIRNGINLYFTNSGSVSLMDVIQLGLGNAAVQEKVVYSGTLGPISTTFANVVYGFENGLLDHVYGASYLDYWMRIPPEFLYPDRPKDYATIFASIGLQSGGGLFELAEAYVNFGILGVFAVPFLVSFILSYVLSAALHTKRLFWVFLATALVSVWIRGTWYQNFAYFKVLILCCLLAGLLMIFSVILKRGLSGYNDTVPSQCHQLKETLINSPDSKLPVE